MRIRVDASFDSTADARVLARTCTAKYISDAITPTAPIASPIAPIASQFTIDDASY